MLEEEIEKFKEERMKGKIESEKRRRKMFSGMKRFEKSETFFEGERSSNSFLFLPQFLLLNFLLPISDSFVTILPVSYEGIRFLVTWNVRFSMCDVPGRRGGGGGDSQRDQTVL